MIIDMIKLYVEPDEAGYEAWQKFRRHYKIMYEMWDHDYVAEKLSEYGAEAKVWGSKDYPHIKFSSKEMVTFFLLRWA